MLARFLAAAFVIVSLGALSCSSDAATEAGNNAAPEGPSRALAVQIVPPASFDGSDAQFNALVDMVTATGVNGDTAFAMWKDIETSPGTYDLSAFTQPVAGLDAMGNKRGLTLQLNIAVLNTTIRGIPEYLANEPLDSPAMKQQFHKLVDALVPVLNSHVVYVAVGNEVDIYFHTPNIPPGDTFSAYASFYADAVAYVHAKAPGVKVGVCATFDSATGEDKQNMQPLGALSDVVVFTYHPLVQGSATFEVRDAASPNADFPAMVAFAQGKPIVVQEVGYSSAPTNRSSEEQQAQYVTNVFAAWKQAAAAIPFLSFYTLHDFKLEDCQAQARDYGQPDNQPFIDYLCSTGLRRSDGTPKAAWTPFVEGASDFK